MKIISLQIFFSLAVIVAFTGCSQENTEGNNLAKAVDFDILSNKFKDYWYKGKAELTSYHLEQARYGEIHQGQAVMIFVTEDFSKSKQVKLDAPAAHPKDAVPILKLNATRKFNTGIYPYSMMTSVFTPVDLEKSPHTLKITTSSQEWCGHTFMQANLKNNQYAVEIRSYFESEGDQNYKTELVMPEDEIWTRLRIDPRSLPTGKVKFLPGSMYSRLKHTAYQPMEAMVTLEPTENADYMTYSVKYKALDRSLNITFAKDFPYMIESWEEVNTSGWGPNAVKLTTRATRNKSMMLDYWKKNGNEDRVLREKLGLE